MTDALMWSNDGGKLDSGPGLKGAQVAVRERGKLGRSGGKFDGPKSREAVLSGRDGLNGLSEMDLLMMKRRDKTDTTVTGAVVAAAGRRAGSTGELGRTKIGEAKLGCGREWWSDSELLARVEEGALVAVLERWIWRQLGP